MTRWTGRRGCSPISSGDCQSSCCEGSDALVPEVIENAPGQSALSYRVGTYATFFESMLAWLVWPPEAPARCTELEPETEPDPIGEKWPLRELTVRESDDPTIALLDAWAIVGDVLTFYQERIANEGFLRTATEQRSVEAIARLVGYRPRPGVAASVDLAFTLDREVVTTIPAGTRAQSLPAPGKLPQSFETSAPLAASARWNAMRPLQSKFLWPRAVDGRLVVYLAGMATNLRVNDVVYRPRPSALSNAIGGMDANHGVPMAAVAFDPVLFRVERIEVLADVAATRVYLRPYRAEDDVYGNGGPEYSGDDDDDVGGVVKSFAGSFNDERDRLAGGRFRSERQILEMVQNDRVLRENFRRALEEVWASRASKTEFFVFRASSPLFGHNAAAERYVGGDVGTTPWLLPGDENNNVVFLDVVNERVQPHSYVVIDQAPSKATLHSIADVQIYSRDAYGIAKQTMRLALKREWFKWPERTNDLAPLRNAVVYHESESLQIARTPLERLDKGSTLIELEGLIFDLEPGRALIVEGEDADAPGALWAERVVISTIEHDLVDLSTRITLASALTHAYLRNRTIIYGNVARATQGETRVEVLGSGDASKPSQRFTLRHQPLTHVPADTPEGVASTLTVRVRGYAWPEVKHRSLLGPRDRKIVTQTDEQGRTIVVGGDGRNGARFPTGVENITAEYRSGLGSDGNIDPHRATNLATRPFGVQKVTNPMPASGGSGPDDIEATRTRAHLAVEALDRLLSIEDHRSFALRFAGIAKARATREGSGGVYARWCVKTVVAGVDARPLDPEGELVARLRQSMRLYGDPSLALDVVPATLARLTIRARVAIATGYSFVEVESRLRPALLDALSYARQAIGQPIWPSRVVALAQAVAGVDFLDLDEVAIVDGTVDDEPLIFDPGQSAPAQPDAVLYLDPDLPETLVLEELTR